MAIRELIFSRLSGFAGLAALVGNRIYPNEAPQDVATPYVVYHTINAEGLQPQLPPTDIDLVISRWQFDAWDASQDTAELVRVQLRLALQRWSDPGPPVVQVAYFITKVDLRDDDEKLHNFSSDYQINYEE